MTIDWTKPEPVLREAWVNLYEDGSISTSWVSEAIAKRRIPEYPHSPHVECRCIAWMSDGSPVPSEASGDDHDPAKWLTLVTERDHWKAKAEALQAEVDDWKSEWEIRCRTVSETLDRRRVNETEALKAEVERLQKVEREWCALHHAEVKELKAEVDKRNDSILDHLDRIQAMKPVVDAAVSWLNRIEGSNLGLPARQLAEAVRTYQSKQAPAEPVKNCTTCEQFDYADADCNFCRRCKAKDYKFWEPRHD